MLPFEFIRTLPEYLSLVQCYSKHCCWYWAAIVLTPSLIYLRLTLCVLLFFLNILLVLFKVLPIRNINFSSRLRNLRKLSFSNKINIIWRSCGTLLNYKKMHTSINIKSWRKIPNTFKSVQIIKETPSVFFINNTCAMTIEVSTKSFLLKVSSTILLYWIHKFSPS